MPLFPVLCILRILTLGGFLDLSELTSTGGTVEKVQAANGGHRAINVNRKRRQNAIITTCRCRFVCDSNGSWADLSSAIVGQDEMKRVTQQLQWMHESAGVAVFWRPAWHRSTAARCTGGDITVIKVVEDAGSAIDQRDFARPLHRHQNMLLIAPCGLPLEVDRRPRAFRSIERARRKQFERGCWQRRIAAFCISTKSTCEDHVVGLLLVYGDRRKSGVRQLGIRHKATSLTNGQR
jgi:hypothetical protein